MPTLRVNYRASRTLAHQYDPNGNRIRLVHPDGQAFDYLHDGIDRYAFSLANGQSWLYGQGFDARGQVYAQSFGMHSAGWSSLFYDGVGRLSGLSYDLPGTALDVGYGFAFNPASQLVSRTRDNDGYAFTGAANGSQAYFRNGLNQYTMVGGVGLAYDANGNLTGDPGVATGSGPTTFTYDVENRLVSASGARNASLRYDPLGRLYEVASGSSTTRFLYDGDALVAEYDAAGAMLRRYVHGASAGADDPQVWYEGAGLAAPRFLHPDHQGSIVSVADASGGVAIVNAYDEYGVPNAANQGRFQYTGQAWLAELGLYHYKARLYSPTLGRFLQTDPVGYEGGINLYGYVANDPVNATDPSGMASCTGSRISCEGGGIAVGLSGTSTFMNPAEGEGSNRPIGPGHNQPPEDDPPPTRSWYHWTRLLSPLGAILSLGGSTCRVCDISLEGVLDNPATLAGVTLDQFRSQVGTPAGWVWTRNSQGGHAGQGWVLRQWGGRSWTGRYVRWQPPNNRHGPDSYWRVNSGRGDSDPIISGGRW